MPASALFTASEAEGWSGKGPAPGALDELDRDVVALVLEERRRPALEVATRPFGCGVPGVAEHLGDLDQGNLHAVATIRRR
jgi:hypothetical protein